MIRNFKLTIEYDGTHFHGWQIQEAGKRTVQGEIEKTLKKSLNKKFALSVPGEQIAVFMPSVKSLTLRPLHDLHQMKF